MSMCPMCETLTETLVGPENICPGCDDARKRIRITDVNEDMHVLGLSSGKRDAIAMLESEGLVAASEYCAPLLSLLKNRRGPPVPQLFKGYVDGFQNAIQSHVKRMMEGK